MNGDYGNCCHGLTHMFLAVTPPEHMTPKVLIQHLQVFLRCAG